MTPLTTFPRSNLLGVRPRQPWTRSTSHRGLAWGPRRAPPLRQPCMGKGRGANLGTLTKRWPPRQARGAAQVAPRSGLEFESRSRKPQRPLAAPAHGWPPRGPSLRPRRAPDSGGPPKCAGFPSTRQEVAAERSPGCGGREGGREAGRGGPGMSPVGGDCARRCDPAIGVWGGGGAGEPSRRSERAGARVIGSSRRG